MEKLTTRNGIVIALDIKFRVSDERLPNKPGFAFYLTEDDAAELAALLIDVL